MARRLAVSARSPCRCCGRSRRWLRLGDIRPELRGRFSEFVSADAAGLKLVKLKMIDEAMPLCATKARAVELLKARKPRAFATIYCGYDSTGEDAFATLGDDDVSVLIGAGIDPI